MTDMVRPPLDGMDRKEMLLEAIEDLMLETIADEDKPVISVLKSVRQLERLLHKALDEKVKKHLDNPDKSIPRKRATRFIEVMEPMIETMKQYLDEPEDKE